MVADLARTDFADSWAAHSDDSWNGQWLTDAAERVTDAHCVIYAPVSEDRRGIVSLKDTRNSQYKELRETLSKAPGLRIR